MLTTTCQTNVVHYNLFRLRIFWILNFRVLPAGISIWCLEQRLRICFEMCCESIRTILISICENIWWVISASQVSTNLSTWSTLILICAKIVYLSWGLGGSPVFWAWSWKWGQVTWCIIGIIVVFVTRICECFNSVAHSWTHVFGRFEIVYYVYFLQSKLTGKIFVYKPCF